MLILDIKFKIRSRNYRKYKNNLIFNKKIYELVQKYLRDNEIGFLVQIYFLYIFTN